MGREDRELRAMAPSELWNFDPDSLSFYMFGSFFSA